MKCPETGKVRREAVGWLANNPLYTQRFAFHVGRRCRKSSIKDVAKELHLHWTTVKELEIEYMKEQLRRFSRDPRPRIIGINEISVKKGHHYRIVVSDLERRRAIWFGGKDRKEKSMDEFFKWLGPNKCKRIEYIVMDMWDPFRTSAEKENHAPQAKILYDKFHVVKHLGEAMDEVRISEYKRLTGQNRQFIKGQKYALLTRRKNLKCKGRRSLKLLFKANRRIYVAYLLKEQFDQIWGYKMPAWARRFFKNWRDALKWQRLKPYEKFARMIDTHWDGIEAYCELKDKIPMGFVEGFNNKIRVIQRRAYGLRDEEYLRLKVLTCMLPEI